MSIEDESPVKGLTNLGNTCFYNAILQCLLHTHPLYTWEELVMEERDLVINEGTVMINENKVEVPHTVINLKETHKLRLVSALRRFLAAFRKEYELNPSPLFRQICLRAPMFCGWAQQDAHELLRYLLDGIRMEEVKRFKEAILVHLGVEDKPDPEKLLLCNAMLESTDRCYVDSIFGGSLLQCIMCSKCKYVSNSLEPFWDLSLPLNYETPASTTVHKKHKVDYFAGTASTDELGKIEKKKKVHFASNYHDTTAENDESPMNIEPLVDNETHDNGENQPSFRDASTQTAAEEGEIEDIELVDNNQGSSENMSVSENDENSNHVAENNGDVPPECDDPSSCTPNYNIILAPSPANENDLCGNLSVINSLKQFTAPENLCASNAYECENCCAPHNKKLPPNSNEKMTVEATKQYLIYSPSCVLTVHLKRFEQVAMGYGNCMRTRKIHGHVDFPFILDISQFCSRNGQRIRSNQNEVIYSLYGIVSHSGDLGGGHYVAYVKSRNMVENLQQFMEAGMKPDRLCQTMEELNNGFSSHQQTINPTLSKDEIIRQLDDGSTWYYASDTYVRKITRNDVKSVDAYILFYERIV